MRIKPINAKRYGLAIASKMDRPYPVQGDEIPAQEEPVPAVPEKEEMDSSFLLTPPKVPEVQEFINWVQLILAHHELTMYNIQLQYINNLNAVPSSWIQGYSMGASVKK
jgi:hypothetical protein